MRQFTSDELRKAWKQFYIDRGHVDVGAVSLVSDGSTGVMFNVAGMQPLIDRKSTRLNSSHSSQSRMPSSA